MKSFWVNRQAKYPYVSRETWWTRYHLLGRKISAQGGCPTVNDRRMAAILRQTAARWAPNAMLEHALNSMEWIKDGNS